MGFIHRQSIRHPWVVLILMFGLVGAVSPGILRLKLRTDGNALVPQDAREVVDDAKIRKAFGIEDFTNVIVDTGRADGIYAYEPLKVLRKLTNKLTASGMFKPGDLTSIVTEKSDRVRSGTLMFRTLLDPFPDEPKDLARLKKDIDEIAIFKGTLVSLDASALAILIKTPRTIDRSELHLGIQQVIDGLGELPDGVDIFMAGPPIAESQLGEYILEDLLGTRVLRALGAAGMTTPVGEAFEEDARQRPSLIAVALGVMAIVFLLAFRSIFAAVLPLMEVGACLVFTFSMMGWFDVPVYLTIAIMPVILTAIGVADELHIFMHYRQVLSSQDRLTRVEAVLATMDKMWRPVLKTSITSSIGFLSFALSPMAPVRMFGIFMAVGIVFCLVWSLTAVPAMLAVIPEGGFRVRRAKSRTPEQDTSEMTFQRNGELGYHGALAALARCVVRWRMVVLLVAGCLVVASPWGVRRLIVQDSWVDAFGPESATYQATQRVNDAFFGAHLLTLDLTADHLVIDETVDVSSFDRHEVRLRASDMLGLLGKNNNAGRLIGEWANFFVKGDGYDAAKIVKPPQGRNVRAFGALVNDVRIEGAVLVLILDLRRNQDLREMLDSGPEVSWGMKVSEGKKRFNHPAILNAVGGLEAFVESRGNLSVGGVVGFHKQVATTNYMVRARRDDMRRTPDTHYEVTRCLKRYKRLRGAARLAEIASADLDRCLVTVFMKDANFVATGQLMDEICAYGREHLEPMGIRVGFSGDVAVSQAMIGAIVETQVQSLLISLVGIVFVTSLLSKSLVWGLLCVIPAGLAVLANFTVMGIFGIPLGVATSMFSGVTIGVGVDYAIHLLERARGATRCSRPDGGHSNGDGSDHVDENVISAVHHSGPAIVVDALGVAFGFGVLMVSQVPANQRLGGLVVVAVGTCLFSTLIILPAIIATIRPRFARGPAAQA